MLLWIQILLYLHIRWKTAGNVSVCFCWPQICWYAVVFWHKDSWLVLENIVDGKCSANLLRLVRNHHSGSSHISVLLPQTQLEGFLIKKTERFRAYNWWNSVSAHHHAWKLSQKPIKNKELLAVNSFTACEKCPAFSSEMCSSLQMLKHG